MKGSEDKPPLPKADSSDASFTRRPTTNVRLQSLLHGDTTVEECFSEAELSSEPQLEEITCPGVRNHPAIALDEISAQLLSLSGCSGLVLLDIEHRVPLFKATTTALDVELAAWLTFDGTPRTPSVPLVELVVILGHHYELAYLIRTHKAQIFCYTLWARERTSLGLTRKLVNECLHTHLMPAEARP